ncbi:MAG TPA: glutamine-hydrolyzing carbamoyl-phosphate synthase small subunit, partial [Bdellovibrionales bacterium]|nr:glutamine-hydrolyzing carbamoyl-phosphate synthase small subunit [Bdellovibrionales bacterium]
MNGYLVLETGEVYAGRWHGGQASSGEVVFNTSHCGYEEIATDPSYYSQIMVMTAPMQGNYGSRIDDWESKKIWLRGFVCLEIHQRGTGGAWLEKLVSNGVPVLSEVDTRSLVLRLRRQGTPWAGLVQAKDEAEARARAATYLAQKESLASDWTALVSTEKSFDLQGAKRNGPRLALIDFGAKTNIINSLLPQAAEIRVFPSTTRPDAIREYNPDGILLSNGPGDPAQVKQGTQTVRELLGWKPIFGICMGHQVLALALGAKTYKLKFGHRGGNHPVHDLLLNKICVTSHNHGYAVSRESLPQGVRVTHVNLNDNTVEGIECASKKCFSVQYHPESEPGPHEASELF